VIKIRRFINKEFFPNRMNASLVLRIFDASSKMDDVQIVPKSRKPIFLLDLDSEMRVLMEEFQLLEHYKGCGHSADWELARKECGDPINNNRYHTYWVHFNSETAANRFMVEMSRRPDLQYSARVPETALGLSGFKLVKRIL
jgi:hypothetical protein